ncbi:MAG: hypothetical protein EP346_08300 [Bacteroidetes bacterium]|nr:MAG: hypothetical protein EP346_08300 [Bacteroidota bacterium]
MIKKTIKTARKKGLIPPIIDKQFNPNMREWNDLSPDEWGAKEVESALEGQPEILPDEIQEGGDNTILYFAQPKSASLYINKLVSKVFEAEEYWVGFNKGSGDLYFPRLVGALLENQLTVSHCHAVADKYVLEMLRNTHPKVLVSYRNLGDTLISRRDMIVRDKGARELMSDSGLERFLSSSKEVQTDITIELFAAQYLNFYSSWKSAANEFDVHFINYDEFISNQEQEMIEMSEEFLDRELVRDPKEVIEEISSGGGVNFNKGKKGRGTDELTEAQRARIRQIAAVFGLEDSDYLGF